MAYQCPLTYLNTILDKDGAECTHENKEGDCDDNGQDQCDYCEAVDAYNEAFAIMRISMNKIEKRKLNYPGG